MKSLEKRLLKYQEQAEQHRKGIERSKDRILRLVGKGDEVVSRYDLMMGYDADYYLNRSGILFSHLKWHKFHLKQCEKCMKVLKNQLGFNQLKMEL